MRPTLRNGFKFVATLGLLSVLSTFSVQATILSSDTTIDLGGTAYVDEDVLSDNQAGTILQLPLEQIATNGDLTAYHLDPDSVQLFSLDTAMSLPGPLTAGPEDVVRLTGSVFAVEFDGTFEGIPPGVSIDAVSRNGLGELLLSFDSTVDLGALIANPEDLVRFDGSAFSGTLVFDGTAEGIAPGVNLDGAAFDPDSGRFHLSFDVSGEVAGLRFDDEDVLEWNPAGSTWSISYDGTSLHTGWVSAGIDAVHVPEPAFLSQIMMGLAVICGLLVCRKRQPQRRSKRSVT